MQRIFIQAMVILTSSIAQGKPPFNRKTIHIIYETKGFSGIRTQDSLNCYSLETHSNSAATTTHPRVADIQHSTVHVQCAINLLHCTAWGQGYS